MNTGVRSIPLGRVCGIPVGAHWSTLVAVIVIGQVVAVSVLPREAPGQSSAVYWTAGVLAALAFMASLLCHELAHALTANRLGVGVRRIDLWLLGGVSQLSSSPATPRIEFLISVAGPGTSALIGALAFGTGTALAAWGAPAVVVSPVVWLAVANGVLAVFNLVPAAPLDGGRVLAAAVWWRTGDERRGAKAAAFAGRAFGTLLVAFGLMQVFAGLLTGLWLVLMGVYLTVSSSAEQSAGETRHRLGTLLVRDVMVPDPQIAPGWWTVQAFLHDLASGPHSRVFPVVAFDGAAVGVVSLAELVGVREPLNTRIADACRALPDVPTAAPDEPLLDVLGRTPLGQRRGVVLVVRDGHVEGLVGPQDVAWALELARAVPLGRHEVTS
ncbi:site-2 protease family protein [Lentzea flava]|uniref:Zinc metalloprotease n=1 Tax=Lentzea flava TaxID=103732 RepID=A0ABQ2US71_9PSEU|nr:site-2 protease family protein [Lentzea flava]MCP2197304.1 Zn-dependent protease (includes SpoIVFB) [Lentzea flava]GGU50079.1 zinc metalloprotease [Lentzea flava]